MIGADNSKGVAHQVRKIKSRLWFVLSGVIAEYIYQTGKLKLIEFDSSMHQGAGVQTNAQDKLMLDKSNNFWLATSKAIARISFNLPDFTKYKRIIINKYNPFTS